MRWIEEYIPLPSQPSIEMAPTPLLKILFNNYDNSNIVLNDNNNNVWNNKNNKNGNTLIQHRNRKSQILETNHGTKYTVTTNQSFTSTEECSNHRFTTKPKERKIIE